MCPNGTNIKNSMAFKILYLEKEFSEISIYNNLSNMVLPFTKKKLKSDYLCQIVDTLVFVEILQCFLNTMYLSGFLFLYYPHICLVKVLYEKYVSIVKNGLFKVIYKIV